MTLTDEELQSFGLADIDSLLKSNNKGLDDFPTMPPIDIHVVAQQPNKLIFDELNYDRVALAQEFLQLISTMTTKQRKIFDKIIERIDQGRDRLLFIRGFGGVGKTYIWRALAAFLRSKGEIVLTVASSGIASLLIPGGRTAHSRFSIPINVNEDATCNIAHGSPRGRANY